MKGCWDSIHVIEAVTDPKTQTCNYSTISSVMLWVRNKNPSFGIVDAAGSVTKRKSLQDKVLDPPTSAYPDSINDSHIKHIGRMIEDLENHIRQDVSNIYFGKTKYVINKCRSIYNLDEEREKYEKETDIAAGLSGAVLKD